MWTRQNRTTAAVANIVRIIDSSRKVGLFTVDVSPSVSTNPEQLYTSMNFTGDSSTAAVSRGTTHREMPIRSGALAENLAEDMRTYSAIPIHLTNRPEG